MDLKRLNSLQSKSMEGFSGGNISRVPSGVNREPSSEKLDWTKLNPSNSWRQETLFKFSGDPDMYMPSYMRLVESRPPPQSPSNGGSLFTQLTKRQSHGLVVQSDSGDNQAIVTCNANLPLADLRKQNSATSYLTNNPVDLLDENKMALIAYQMIERHKTDLRTVRRLGVFQKAFLSNLVHIESAGKQYVNPELPVDDYLARINYVLQAVLEERINTNKVDKKGNVKIDRKDNKLRWLYKHFISFLLQRETSYTPDKNHRREDYTGVLIKKFFRNDNSFKEELDTTEFASLKKFKRMFIASPDFKQEFIDFTNNELRQMSKKEGIRKYELMYKEVLKIYEENAKFIKKPVLSKTRRLHDLEIDVEGAILLLNRSVKN